MRRSRGVVPGVVRLLALLLKSPVWAAIILRYLLHNIEEEMSMAMPNQFNNPENDRAFRWLTTPGSMQAAQLEHAMRNYEQPVYDPADVGQHLLKALSLPMAGYAGDASKADAIPLGVAMISHACAMGWDIVEEIGPT